MLKVKRNSFESSFRHLAKAVTASMLGAMLLLIIGCGPSDKKQPAKDNQPSAENKEGQAAGSYAQIASAMFIIDTYDNNRILETGMGFFVAPDVVVTRLSYFLMANKAVIKPFDEKNTYPVSGYVAVDRINDLILLKMQGIMRNPVTLSDSIAREKQKTFYISKPTTNVVPVHEGTVLSYSSMLGTMLYRVSNQLRSKSAGSPVFNQDRLCIGLAFMQVADYETQTFVTPSIFIADLLKRTSAVRPLSELQSASSDSKGQDNSRVKGIVIETGMGNISIRLYDQTPQYRDNFIQLTREGYYDNLLIHRVISGFGIQSGAADTRYATTDDVVGWKGPGYTLPAHIVPGLYHRRGVVGSPRKPETENSRKRSDGSQFYIVTGRTYSDSELDDLEKEISHQFTPEQRNTYKTIGGAPHLDGTYTIFGEVTEGLEVADRISEVEVGSEFRPKKDLRIKKIRILE
ncbi:MAG TPA: peptidylprolyl isomerase [Prolixibacteraceae bacterium]|nr:peptidylprolyl isomerase [Prolixibacteraceae bacterium]